MSGRGRIRIDHYGWPGIRDDKGLWPCDGVVWYLVEFPGTEHTMSLLQPFVLGAHRQDATGRISMKNLWGWDGNREAPTLSPSYLAKFPFDGFGNQVVHLFLKAGRIALCGDSTVDLAPHGEAGAHPPA